MKTRDTCLAQMDDKWWRLGRTMLRARGRADSCRSTRDWIPSRQSTNAERTRVGKVSTPFETIMTTREESTKVDLFSGRPTPTSETFSIFLPNEHERNDFFSRSRIHGLDVAPPIFGWTSGVIANMGPLCIPIQQRGRSKSQHGVAFHMVANATTAF